MFSYFILLFCHLTFHCKCACDGQKKKTAFIDGEISSPVSPSDTCERQTGIQRSISTPSLTSKHRGGTAEHTTLSDLFEDRLSEKTPSSPQQAAAYEASQHQVLPSKSQQRTSEKKGIKDNLLKSVPLVSVISLNKQYCTN